MELVRMHNNETFLINSRIVHGDDYKYLEEYKGSSVKIWMVHNDNDCNYVFQKSPNKHITAKQGCPKCGIAKRGIKQRHTHEWFLQNQVEIHGENRYLTLGKYSGRNAKIKIKCLTCDHIFNKTSNHHINRKQGCPLCSRKHMGDVMRNDTVGYLKMLLMRDDKGEFYGYDRVYYTGIDDLVEIFCPKCNDYFDQLAGNHLHSNHGCPFCAIERNAELLRDDTLSYLNKLFRRNDGGNYYGYDDVVYVSGNVQINIYCPDCNKYFKQTASHHLRGNGHCTNCTNSLGVKRIIKFLQNYDIVYVLEYRYGDCRYINTLPFDFYLSEYDILIEYDGEQHHNIIYGKDSLERTQRNDLIKTQYCLDNNIPLIRIKYDVENIENYLQEELNKIINY